MLLVKVLVVLSLLAAGSYGHSQSAKPSKWRSGQDGASWRNDRLAKINYFFRVPESKYRLDEVPCYAATPQEG